MKRWFVTARFTKRIAVSATLLCLSQLAVADAVAIWHPPEYFERTFGDVRIVVGTPRPPEGLPGWPVLYVSGKRITDFPRLLAQEVYGSPDNNYFLLLSNLGLSSYAIAVIDRQGQILFGLPHDQNPFIGDGKFHYCRASVTNVREWVDLKGANPGFELSHDSSTTPNMVHFAAVTVRGCDGKDIALAPPAQGE